jgi:hypothetical protein
MQTANLEPELNSLLSKLDEQIAEDSKQTDVLAKRIKKNEALRQAIRGSLGALHPGSDATGYGSKVVMIREAINRLPNPRFTQDDVEAEIGRVNPEIELDRNRVRAAIWTLCNKHKAIKLIRKGSNRLPAEFEKQASQTNGAKSGPPPRKVVPV